MQSLVFLPVTQEIAEQAGRLKPSHGRQAKSLSFQDATIAAVAIPCDCMLVTENVKDFPMPELRLYPLMKQGT